MNKKILMRLLLLCTEAYCSIYFIATRGLRLGLDLRGGVQIDLSVETDEAIRAERDKANLDGLHMPASDERSLRENATVQAMRVIENRLNGRGLSDMTIQRFGA